MRRRGIKHLTVWEFAKQHYKLGLVAALGVVVLSSLLIQFIYPRDRLVPFTQIDGLEVGHWTSKDAAWELDKRYEAITEDIYFGDNSQPHVKASLEDIGTTIDNNSRLIQIVYPWYFRLIPSSLLWYHQLNQDPGPKYQVDTKKQQAFIDDLAGKNCQVKPINASLKADDGKLTVVSAIPGGECQPEQVKQLISQFKPRLNQANSVRIPVVEKPAKIGDEIAAKVADEIMTRVDDGLSLKAGQKTIQIPAIELYSWLKFSATDNDLIAEVDPKPAKSFFDKNITPLVYRPAGTTRITTKDFMEISRNEGARGQTLDEKATAESLAKFINSGQQADVKIATTSPKVEYKRLYTSSNAGLAALMTNFANSNKGTYGVAMYELSGQRRRADYNGSKSFVTASTYKLFVAYSTIKRVDSGKWKWSDKNIAGGRNRGQCFEDMIVKSDNPCAEALLKAVGYSTITKELQQLGLKNTSFIAANTPHSTALDEAQFLAQLATDQLPISDSGRTKLLSAMKSQIFRQGIPAGIPSVTVAGKVGFLWGLLHDAAIVYSPKGTYVLVILTDNSSWQNIAKLAKEIEKLR